MNNTNAVCTTGIDLYQYVGNMTHIKDAACKLWDSIITLKPHKNAGASVLKAYTKFHEYGRHLCITAIKNQHATFSDFKMEFCATASSSILDAAKTTHNQFLDIILQCTYGSAAAAVVSYGTALIIEKELPIASKTLKTICVAASGIAVVSGIFYFVHS